MDIIITIIITSIVWAIFFITEINNLEKKKVSDALDVPADFNDATFYDDKVHELNKFLRNTSTYRDMWWKDILPPECHDFSAVSENPELEAFVKTVKLVGRDLAILNKNGDIEVKV